MGVVIILVLFFVAAAACLGAAYVVLQRERATRATPQCVPAPPPVAAEPETQFLSREEMFGAASSREDDRTTAITREALFVAAERRVPSLPRTEIIPLMHLRAAQQAMQPAPTPKPEPKPAPPPPTIGFSVAELEAQVLVAEQAFIRWRRDRESLALDRLADGPERVLQQAIGVLVAASEDASMQLLEPTVRSNVGDARRQVIALALLSRNENNALRLFDQLVGDPRHADVLREVLTLWRGRETNWRLCEQARRAQDTKLFWLDLVHSRHIDPGPQLLRELLASDDPDLLVRGLELAKYHDDAELRSSAMQSHLHDMRHPARRMAAVEIGVYDSQPTAWTVCRQMANAAEYPRATELIASLGTLRELGPIVRRLESARGDGLWLLCQSGRKAAAALAARRLQDTRADELAMTALRYVIGNPPNEAPSAEALLEHWAARAPDLADDRRYLFGELFGGTNGIRECFASRDEEHHRALGNELFFRSRGKIRWAGPGFARETLAAISSVGTPYINYEASFGPW